MNKKQSESIKEIKKDLKSIKILKSLLKEEIVLEFINKFALKSVKKALKEQRKEYEEYHENYKESWWKECSNPSCRKKFKVLVENDGKREFIEPLLVCDECNEKYLVNITLTKKQPQITNLKEQKIKEVANKPRKSWWWPF